MTPYELIVLGLATHQAIVLWFNGSLFIPIRERLSHPHEPQHRRLSDCEVCRSRARSALAELVNCAICMSVWCGAALYLAWHLPYVHAAIWVLAIIDVANLAGRAAR